MACLECLGLVNLLLFICVVHICVVKHHVLIDLLKRLKATRQDNTMASKLDLSFVIALI